MVATLLFVAPAVSFAASLNDDPQDFATLRVVNYTVNSSCVTCWSSSATANPGDIVSFAIYYHNTGSDTARNVRVRISPQTTAVGTTHSFSASVSADNAPTVTGNATVITTSNQTVSFLSGGVIWRPNQTVFGNSPLPFGQTANDIFNGNGITLGDVAPGWETQGSVIVRFQTSSTGGNVIPSLPSVTTNSATNISQNSATLSGFVTPNGSNTNTWFEWGTTPSLGNTTNSVNSGSNATSFSASLFNLNSNTVYYYRAVAQNSAGIAFGSTLSFATLAPVIVPGNNLPYVTTNSASNISQNSATLNGYVLPNSSNTNVWFEWGITQSLGNSTNSINYGTNGTSFMTTLYNLNSNTTYYYRAVAQNSAGTVYGNILSLTTSSQTYVNNNTSNAGAPTVTTLLATELTGTTAKLNGLVFAAGGQASSVWFEWGSNASLGNKTQTVSAGTFAVVKHSDFISGLTKGQTYYYRIVAENSSGRVYGTVNTFVSDVSTYVAPRPVVTRPTVTRPTTEVVNVGQTQSLVSLSIEGGDEAILAKDKRAYHVTWKNESTQVLRDVVLRVSFPQSMFVESATKGSFSAVDNSVIINLKTLDPKQTGDTFIFATAGENLKAGEILVVSANLVYTQTTNGVQGDAIAYVTHRVEVAQSTQGASIFGAGDFIPSTLFEWLLLIILVLILVLLGNHLYGRFAEEKH